MVRQVAGCAVGLVAALLRLRGGKNISQTKVCGYKNQRGYKVLGGVVGFVVAIFRLRNRK
jgi:hypothetical protein